MPSRKQEQYKHERISQLANPKRSRCADNQPLCSHQLQAVRSPSYSTLAWVPQGATLASGNLKSSTDLPCLQTAMALHLDGVITIKTALCEFQHSNPEKEMVLLWKKKQCWDVLPEPLCTVVFPRNWGQQNVGGLKKKKNNKHNQTKNNNKTNHNWKDYAKAKPFSFLHCVRKSDVVQDPSQILSGLDGNAKCNLHQISPKFDLMFFQSRAPFGEILHNKSKLTAFQWWHNLTEIFISSTLSLMVTYRETKAKPVLKQASHDGAKTFLYGFMPF